MAAKRKAKALTGEACVRRSVNAYLNFGHELEPRDVTRIAKKCRVSEATVLRIWSVMKGEPLDRRSPKQRREQTRRGEALKGSLPDVLKFFFP